MIDLAGILKCDVRALGMLATALTALNFLERDGERLKATESSKKYLSTTSDEYFGFAVLHMAHILPAWTRLEAAVKTGASVADSFTQTTEDEARREAFLMGMFNIARQQAGLVAEAFDLAGRRRLLDLGGGPGTYALYFCLRHPELTATIFDQPTTEKFARATAARFGLTGRVDFLGGDFTIDELPGGFDAAWLSQILHGDPPAVAAGVVKKAAGALASGGIMGIQEFIIDDDRRGPAQPALFALNMLVQTPGGQAYTQGEIHTMMAEAGLKDIHRLQADLPPGCGIMVGLKP